MSEFNTKEKNLLLSLAKKSIKYGITHNKCMDIELDSYPKHLKDERACFVTLHLNNQLRGCIGSLIANRPLVADVVANAYEAAFSDPRFYPLSQDEFDQIDLDISVLSVPEQIKFDSEEDLLKQIRPNIDGLILTFGLKRGTFLPSVWEELPEKKDFLKNLKVKAGLNMNFWDENIRIDRYTAELLK